MHLLPEKLRMLYDNSWKIKHHVRHILSRLFPKYYEQGITMETTDTVVPKVNCQSLIVIGKSLGASNQIKQRQRKAWHIPSPTNLTRWPWKLIGFQVYLRTKYVPSLVKIHWRMLILECSQGCYAVKIWPGELDHWPWKSIGFQIHLKTKYVPSLVKIHWRMLILKCSQGCYVVKIWPGDLDLWPWKSTGFQILLRTKYVPSLVKIHWRMLILECSQGCYGRTDGSVTISLRNFVGEGIIKILFPQAVTLADLAILDHWFSCFHRL
jgi:hypothetical protein